MSLEMTNDSQPYSNTVIQVGLNNFTLVEIGMDGLLKFYFLTFSMFNIGEYSLYGNLVFPIIPQSCTICIFCNIIYLLVLAWQSIIKLKL